MCYRALDVSRKSTHIYIKNQHGNGVEYPGWRQPPLKDWRGDHSRSLRRPRASLRSEHAGHEPFAKPRHERRDPTCPRTPVELAEADVHRFFSRLEVRARTVYRQRLSSGAAAPTFRA